jgi:hypothetical protein
MKLEFRGILSREKVSFFLMKTMRAVLPHQLSFFDRIDGARVYFFVCRELYRLALGKIDGGRVSYFRREPDF